MSQDSHGDYFIDYILLVALAKCFRSGDQYLTTEELFQRGFAPLESFCGFCVDRLASKNLVESKFSISPDVSDGAKAVRYIGLLADDSQTPYESRQMPFDLIINSFSGSTDFVKCLSNLRRDIQVCECIEVGEFYANVWGLEFQNVSFSNPKLALLVHEENTEVVQTLIVRTLKRSTKKFEHSHVAPLDFHHFINDVCEFYLRCKRRGTYIHGQPRPTQLKRSILAEMLEGYPSQI
jgi:hypothetical protein